MRVLLTLLFTAAAAHGGDIVWEGERRVDGPLSFAHRNLVLKPGARVTFGPAGRISLRNGNFRAVRAELAGEGILTNAYRVEVVHGRLDLDRCRVLSLRTSEPVKGAGYFTGALCARFGDGSRATGCTFVDSSALTYVNVKGVSADGNLFVRPHTGLYLFHARDCRVSGNGFFDAPDRALSLGAVSRSDVTDNRFTDCAIALASSGSTAVRFTGNSFFGGRMGVRLWSDGKDNLWRGNLFEDVSLAAVSGHSPAGDGAVFANNLAARCGAAFSFPAQPEGTCVVFRDNAVFRCGTGFSLAGGAADAPVNAVWRTKRPLSLAAGAVLRTPGWVTDDPRFTDPEAGDYRLRPDSPLRGAGTGGGDIGLFGGGE